MRNFADELVLPFLWAQDGFSEPSEEMAKAIKFGLDAPSKLSLLGGVALIAIGGGLVLGALRSCAWSTDLDAGYQKKC